MNRDDIHKLIAGYATGTLTEDERTALFAAALEDQDLFDELAREQELKELIEEPGVRSRLVAALEPKKKWWEKAHWTWAAAATVAAVLLGVFLIQPPEPKRLAMVMPEPPKISQAPVPFVEPPPVGQAAPPLPPPAAVRQAQNGATPTLPPPPVQNANAPADALREVTIAAAPPPPPAAPAPAPAARAVTPIPQEAIGQLHEFGEPVGALARRPHRLTENRRVPADTSRSDTEREPSARDVVERHELLRERHRMPEVGRRDERAEANAFGRGGRRGQGRDRTEPRGVAQCAPGQVVVRPRVVEAELLGPPPDGLRGAPRMFGQDHHSDADAGVRVLRSRCGHR